MEFQDVVRRRRMIREYADTPVDPAVVDRALANAVRAPSAGLQPGLGVPGARPAPPTSTASGRSPPTPGELPDSWLAGMQTAPVVVIPCSSKAAYLGRYAEPDKGWTDEDEARWPVPFWHMDAAMASLLILLTAVDEGLGSCFFGIPPEHEAAVRDAFGIPPEFDPVGAITLGHRAPDEAPSGSATTRRRKPQTDVVHRGSWG